MHIFFCCCSETRYKPQIPFDNNLHVIPAFIALRSVLLDYVNFMFIHTWNDGISSSYPHRLKSIEVYWATYTIYWNIHRQPRHEQITHIIPQSVLFRGQHVPWRHWLHVIHLTTAGPRLWISHCFPATFLLMGIYSSSNFSAAISVAMITGHLRLCEHVWRFARQITRTRDGLPGAQSICTFNVNRCYRQTLLSSWTVPSLPPNAPSRPWLQQLVNDNHCCLLSVYWMLGTALTTVGLISSSHKSP